MNSPFQGKLGDTLKDHVERTTGFLRPIGLLLAITAAPILIALAVTAGLQSNEGPSLGQPSLSGQTRAVGEPGNDIPRLLGSPTLDGVWIFGIPDSGFSLEEQFGVEPLQSGTEAVATGEIGGDLTELEPDDFPEALALIEEDEAAQAAPNSSSSSTNQAPTAGPGSSSTGSRNIVPTAPVAPGGSQASPANTQPAPSSGQAANPASTARPPAATANPTTTAAPRPTTPPTTAAPRPTTPPTTAAPRPAPTTQAPRPNSGQVLLNATFGNVTPFGFGQNRNTVSNNLGQTFGTLSYLGGGNWDDWSVVSDANGGYLRTRSNVGNSSHKQFNVPIQPAQETYLVYQFYLEPGFDAGDGNNSEGSPSWGTGIKMPGLMRGNPVDNTGGNHTAGGFSGRLMIRGTNSNGANHEPRDGLTLAAYVYGQEIGNQNIASGFGEDYYFLDGFNSRPFEGINNGTHEGVGDPRIWELETGQWITVVLGYRVDGDNGWFKAWTATGNGSLQPRLHIPNVNWTGGNRTDGPDSLLIQNFWGGQGSVWHPDSVSYMRFRNFAVYTTQADALAAAR